MVPLSKFSLGEFQGFSKPQEITIKPITFLFGPNSSGKSSIARMLTLMQHSSFDGAPMNRKAVPTELIFSRPNERDLGGFDTLVHRHEIERNFEFAFTHKGRPTWIGKSSYLNNHSKDQTLTDAPDVLASFQMRYANPGVLAYLRISFHDVEGSYFGQIQMEASEDTTVIEEASEDTTVIESDTRGRPFRVTAIDSQFLDLLADFQSYTTARFPRWRPKSARPVDFKKLQEDCRNGAGIVYLTQDLERQFGSQAALGEVDESERQELELIEDLIQDIGKVQRRAFQNVSFVDSLRTIPNRIDSFRFSSRVKLLRNGSNIVEWLLNEPDRIKDVSRLLEEVTSDRYSLTIEQLQVPHFEYLRYYALLLIDNESGVTVSFEDAGTGLSQMLPILANLALFDSPTSNSPFREDRVLVIEQPELHLHPRMQAKLMDLIIDVAFRQLSTGSEHVLILETHSEAMLMRLQRRIFERKINVEDVSINFIEAIQGSSVATQLRLDEDGSFKDRWPSSFSSIRREDSF